MLQTYTQPSIRGLLLLKPQMFLAKVNSQIRFTATFNKKRDKSYASTCMADCTIRALADLEHLLGTPILIRVRLLKDPIFDAKLFVFKNEFFARFSFLCEEDEYTVEYLCYAAIFFGKTHDLEYFIQVLTAVLASVPFPSMQFQVSGMQKVISYV